MLLAAVGFEGLGRRGLLSGWACHWRAAIALAVALALAISAAEDGLRANAAQGGSGAVSAHSGPPGHDGRVEPAPIPEEEVEPAPIPEEEVEPAPIPEEEVELAPIPEEEVAPAPPEPEPTPPPVPEPTATSTAPPEPTASPTPTAPPEPTATATRRPLFTPRPTATVALTATPEGAASGVWTGITSQGRSITLVLQGGSITTMVVAFWVGGCGGAQGTVTFEGAAFPPGGRTFSAFTVVGVGSLAGTVRVAGSFDGARSASGTLSIHVFRLAGLDFCSDSVQATWTAAATQ